MSSFLSILSRRLSFLAGELPSNPQGGGSRCVQMKNHSSTCHQLQVISVHSTPCLSHAFLSSTSESNHKAYVNIRRHMSAYVSIRQHTLLCLTSIVTFMIFTLSNSRSDTNKNYHYFNGTAGSRYNGTARSLSRD